MCSESRVKGYTLCIHFLVPASWLLRRPPDFMLYSNKYKISVSRFKLFAMSRMAEYLHPHSDVFISLGFLPSALLSALFAATSLLMLCNFCTPIILWGGDDQQPTSPKEWWRIRLGNRNYDEFPPNPGEWVLSIWERFRCYGDRSENGISLDE